MLLGALLILILHNLQDLRGTILRIVHGLQCHKDYAFGYLWVPLLEQSFHCARVEKCIVDPLG